MAQIIINTGNVANDGQGDPLRTAFNDTNTNFTQVFTAGPVGSNIRIANNTISTTNINGNLILAPNGIGSIVASAPVMPDIPGVRMIGSNVNPFNTVYSKYIDANLGIFSGNLYVSGNINVNGNVVTVGYSNITVANTNITLANGASNGSQADGSGLLIAGANTGFTYNFGANSWVSNIAITAQTFIGDGANLSNVIANVNSISLLGNTLSNSVIYSNLTTFGALTGISSTGNISTTGNVYANVITGNIIIGILSGDGGNISNISASAVVGNIPYALNSHNALTANLAALATQAINANTALYAINANIANSANTATSALTANSATYAIQADMANSAVVAGISEQLSPLANLSITGNITTSGYFIGDGGLISNIVVTTSYGNSNVTALLSSGNVTTDYLTSGNIIANNFVGTNIKNPNSSTNISVNTNNVTIYSSTYPFDATWIFNNAGTLTLPNTQNNGTSLIAAADRSNLTLQTSTEYNLVGSYASGSGYSTASNVATTGGTGTGLTVDIVATSGSVTSIIVNNPGTGYTNNDNILITGGDNNSNFFLKNPNPTASSATFSWAFDVTGNLTLPTNTSSINYANGSPYGGGSVYANTVGSFGSDMGIGNNYNLNDPAILFSGDDMLIRTGGTSAVGGINYGQIDIAASEQLFIGLAGNLADATYVPTGNYIASIQFPSGGTTINVVTGNNVWAFDNTGNLNAPGNISASGNITGNFILGNIAFANGIPATYGNSNVADFLANFGSNSISTTGNVFSGDISATGNLYIGGNANVQGNLTFNDVTNITTANLVIGLGNTQTGINVNGGGMVVGNTNEAQFLYDYSTQNWNSNIGISAVGTITAGNLTTSGIGGNITGANVISATTISVTSNVYAVEFITSNTVINNGISTSGAVTANSGLYTTNISIDTQGAGNNYYISANWTNTANTIFTTGNLVTTSVPADQLKLYGTQQDISNIGYPVTFFDDSFIISGYNGSNASGYDHSLIAQQGNINIVSGITGNLASAAYNNIWTFDTTGTLTLPGAAATIYSSNAFVNIVSNGDGSSLLALAATDNAELQGAANVVIQSNNIGNTSYIWNFDNTGNLSTPGNISVTGNIIFNSAILANAGANTTTSIIRTNQNPPAGTEAYGIEMYTSDSSNPGLYSSISSGTDYVGMLSSNAGNANIVLQGGYGITFSTSNASGGAIQTWTFEEAGDSLFPGNISTAGNIQSGYFIGNGSQLTGITTSASGESSFTIQSNNFSATQGNRYGVNTTGASVTATLPSTPSTGGAIFFADAGGAFATNNLIVNPNGGTIMGASGNMTVSTNNQSFGLFYNGTTWRTYNAG